MEVMNCLTLKDLVSSKKVKTDIATHGKHAHKENMFVDRSRSTPMKNEPIDLSKQRGFTPDRSPITPIKLADKTQSEPWTPTANLKMLISAASPDIRDREKKKELFRPIENNEQDDEAPEAGQVEADAADDGSVDDYEKRPSRKQKSLGLLCQKFLARYPSYPLSTEKTTISLDEVAATLGVERRRIYDIVNVLESLNLVSRVAKNQYCWHGLHGLKQTLKNLHCLGTLQKYEEQIAYFQHKDGDTEHRVGERKKDNMTFQSRHVPDFAEADYHSASANSRKDKSLRIMSQKFVMLFLVSTTNVVTLEIAAKILIEESQDVSDQGKFKTKVRRLYDIANVLTSLGLIKKVHVTEERGRKPAFKWIGPTDFNALCSDQRIEVTPTTLFQGIHNDPSSQSQTSNLMQTFSRHTSFNDVHVPEEGKRKVSSEPNSPDRDIRDNGVSLEDLPTKKERLVAVCRKENEENAKSRKPSPERSRFAGNSATTPFSVGLPAPRESEHCLKSTQITSTASQSNNSQISLQNCMLGHTTATADNRNPALLTSQPFVCLPSASVYMLYHNLRDSSTTENLTNAGDFCRSHYDSWASPDRSSLASSAVSPCSAGEEEEPANKIRKTDMQEDALSLVLPKKHLKPTELKYLQRDSCLPADQGDDHCQTRCHSPGIAEEQELNKSYAFNGQKNMTLQMDHSELVHPKGTFIQENMASVPQYLYVPSSACLNGFNFLLSANQATGAVALSTSHLPPVNVPCVMVPSSSLAQFPFLCSPSIAGQLPTAPSTSATNVGSMNFNAPGMASATHLLIGAASMVASKADESPSLESLQVYSPVVGSAESSVRTDSAVCRGQPLAMKNPQQSSTPQTPKNIHRTQHETFFKTPGSLGSPITWRRSEGALRTSSSAQRRLQISSGGTE
ncbi:transcription factor E2F7 isoform X2 [Lissotriton helveticus]